MNNVVNTELLCLKQVVDAGYQFVIPSYQRPYVWSSIHIEDLLNDIEEAFNNDEPHYFIGTTLSSKKDHSTYELIDGQQRTTTLMLFALACHDYQDSVLKGHPILKVSTYAKKPRLHFEIREKIESYLGSQAGLEGFGEISQDQLTEDAYLKHIHAGLEFIKQRLKKIYDSGIDLKEFIHYMFENVRWINNIIPKKTDLNKLFSSMNTSGIQLEPVDILKSKIFRTITKNKKRHEAIWDACQNMNTYFERVLRKKIEASSWNELSYEGLEQYDAELMLFEVDSESSKVLLSNGLSIQEIDGKRNIVSRETDNDNKIDGEDQIEEDIPEENKNHCRSFISFELLLIHTLRIYKVLNDEQDIEERLIASNLQNIFKNFIKDASEPQVKKFLNLLWQVRYQFDTWCVKWLENEDGGGEELRLTSISKPISKKLKKTYYPRNKSHDHSALELLQSVRIFTGERSAQYWLTPFLFGLMNADSSLGQDDVVEWLEKIDNDLSLASVGVTQKEASYQLCLEDEIETKDWQEIQEYLESQKGTSFEHYWFQKLEYVLWKNHRNRKDKRFKKYRITAKNSVEHVRPQKERYNKSLNKALHSFGNLALLSPGQNSEYSNKPIREKKAKFYGKPVYDSLKLKNLFDRIESDSNLLNSTTILQHQNDMLALLEQHYNSEGV